MIHRKRRRQIETDNRPEREEPKRFRVATRTPTGVTESAPVALVLVKQDSPTNLTSAPRGPPSPAAPSQLTYPHSHSFIPPPPSFRSTLTRSPSRQQRRQAREPPITLLLALPNHFPKPPTFLDINPIPHCEHALHRPQLGVRRLPISKELGRDILDRERRSERVLSEDLQKFQFRSSRRGRRALSASWGKAARASAGARGGKCAEGRTSGRARRVGECRS